MTTAHELPRTRESGAEHLAATLDDLQQLAWELRGRWGEDWLVALEHGVTLNVLALDLDPYEVGADDAAAGQCVDELEARLTASTQRADGLTQEIEQVRARSTHLREQLTEAELRASIIEAQLVVLQREVDRRHRVYGQALAVAALVLLAWIPLLVALTVPDLPARGAALVASWELPW